MLYPGKFGVFWMTAERANYGRDAMLVWLRQIGAHKIFVHLDLDVITRLA